MYFYHLTGLKSAKLLQEYAFGGPGIVPKSDLSRLLSINGIQLKDVVDKDHHTSISSPNFVYLWSKPMDSDISQVMLEVDMEISEVTRDYQHLLMDYFIFHKKSRCNVIEKMQLLHMIDQGVKNEDSLYHYYEKSFKAVGIEFSGPLNPRNILMHGRLIENNDWHDYICAYKTKKPIPFHKIRDVISHAMEETHIPRSDYIKYVN